MSVTIELLAARAGETARRRRPRGAYWLRVVRRLRRDPVTVVCALVLLTIAVLAIAAPLIAPANPYKTSMLNRLLAPGAPHHLLGTEEFMVINHTDCGLMQTTEQDLRARIQNRAGTEAIAPAFFYAFQNIDENVRHQLQKLRTHPWVPASVTIRGFVYDVATGRLREIKDS